MQNPETEGTSSEIVKKAQEWVSSDEGNKKIVDALKAVVRITNELAEARRVDETVLEKPITM